MSTMNSSASITNTSSNAEAEQKLGNILQLLNSPEPNYALLADEALRLQSDTCLPPGPSIERAIAKYFDLFAHGHDKWLVCYDYHIIHEHFYGAYLQALQKGGSCLSQNLKDMLEEMTNAFTAYTWCENALICNNPQSLLDSATLATESGEKALKSLADSSLDQVLRVPIEGYLLAAVNHWKGFKLCAEMYLAPSKNEQISKVMQRDVHQLMKSLEKHPGRASEVRAHSSFAQRFAQAHAQRDSDLRVKGATLLLRASGYVGEDLTATLFDKFEKNVTLPKEDVEVISKKTQLPIVSVRLAPMQDIFETVLGEDYLKQIIFELSTLDPSTRKPTLTFSIPAGEEKDPKDLYSVETFQVRLTRFGTISVEFEFTIGDASVSHVRVLESLLAPYAGRFDFVWREAPQDTEPESMNYVDHFLRSQQWITSIKKAMKNEPSPIVTEMEKVCDFWKSSIHELAEWLHPEPQNEPSKQDEQLDDKHKTLHKHGFLAMRDLAHQWIKEHKASTSIPIQKIVQEGNHLYPSGTSCVRFGLLMDIAKEVMKHMIQYFSPHKEGDVWHLPLRAVSDVQLRAVSDVQRLTSFDHNTGWMAILLCDNLTPVKREGQKFEPVTERDYYDYRDDDASRGVAQEFGPVTESDHYRIVAHPEFKGLIIQPREARSGIDDWLSVATPPYRNLATVRSHQTDAMYIGENHAFLYLPDDPQFLTAQYVESVRFMDDIRVLLRSFNVIAKEQIKRLESGFKDIKSSKRNKIVGLSERKSSEFLLSRRDEIEDFRTHAEKILDLLRSTSISRFQDHSELLQEMIKESRVDDIRNSLERNIATLDRFHTYLTERLKRSIDERFARLVLILTIVSTLAAVFSAFPFFSINSNALETFLSSLLIGVIGFIGQRGVLISISILLIVFLAVVLRGRIISTLTGWQKNKRSKKDESY